MCDFRIIGLVPDDKIQHTPEHFGDGMCVGLVDKVLAVVKDLFNGIVQGVKICYLLQRCDIHLCFSMIFGVVNNIVDIDA